MLRLRIFKADGQVELLEFVEAEVRAITVEAGDTMTVFPDTEEAAELVFGGESVPDENPEISESLDAEQLANEFLEEHRNEDELN